MITIKLKMDDYAALVTLPCNHFSSGNFLYMTFFLISMTQAENKFLHFCFFAAANQGFKIFIQKFKSDLKGIASL